MNGYICKTNGDPSSNAHSSAMESTGYKIFNDSVHGHITLHPLLVQVVDTPEFQRLRNIKQLGVANYVFPGANNCRYEHSLGTCYLAGKMVEKLFQREQLIRPIEDRKRLALCVQLAALCHDLGHGPFSHTWEHVTHEWGYSWKHEESSVEMLEYLIQKNNLLGAFRQHKLNVGDVKIIKQLIMGGPYNGEKPMLKEKDNFLFEIVSNKQTGIDVDKWDYFLRDGLHLNLSITFDYRRLLEFCTVISDDSDVTHIAFRDKEIMNLYDMFRVRSALHHTAYRHKVVINIEIMLVDAFRAAGNAGYKINNSEIALKDGHLRPESMSKLTDHVFYDILYSNDPALKNAQTIMENILSRRLYVFVGKANILIPETVEVKDRQGFIKSKKAKLEERLTKEYENHMFRVGDFFLDLDSQNDPVSKVRFYTKQRGSNEIRSQSYQEIRDILDPFPFHLTKEATAVLYVFCTTIGVADGDLVKAKDIIKEISQ